MECILSFKNHSHNGYPRVSVKGKMKKLHRVVYCEAKGIPLSAIDGLLVRHTCDTPNCVEPTHLVLGTTNDNMQDKVKRGRQAKGEDFRSAKLDAEKVKYIRKHTIKGSREFGLGAMARRFGVSVPTISYVVMGTTWKHI